MLITYYIYYIFQLIKNRYLYYNKYYKFKLKDCL